MRITSPFGDPADEKNAPFQTRFNLAGRAGFEPAAEFNPGTHLAGEPNQPLWHLPNRFRRSAFRCSPEACRFLAEGGLRMAESDERRERDSNPRWVAPHLFSRQAP